MKFPLLPKMLKHCLIIGGSLALTGLICFMLVAAAYCVMLDAMFPYAREAAKLPINQQKSSDFSPFIETATLRNISRKQDFLIMLKPAHNPRMIEI